MKLEEKHKEFVVISFARFMKLTDIIDAFIEKFTDELPSVITTKVPNKAELMARPLDEEQLEEKQEFIDETTEDYRKEFEKKYGDEAEAKLKEKVLKEFEFEHGMDIDRIHSQLLAESIAKRQEHLKQLRQNLFNRFRRLDINHPQFPKKYRDLFIQTRDEYCANHRTPDLNLSDNLSRELETIYGYQKQLLFQQSDSEEVMKHMNSAHQILKTIVAHNTVNASQEVVDITPQNVKALEDNQKALTAQLKEVTQQLAQNTDKS